MLPNCRRTTLEPTLTTSPASATGDHAVEHCLKENTYAIYPNANFTWLWEQHIHYNNGPTPYVSTPTDSSPASLQSSELPLALPALPQTEEIEAEQAVGYPHPSPHQLPSRQLEVTELAKPIFLVPQVSVSISPHCQQWMTSTIFPTMTATIPDVIVQPLPTNNVAAELPIETAILNVTNDYNYKVEYVKGKDNACTNFVSRKDDREKPLIPNTEDLAAQIFHTNFRPAGALSDTDLMISDILPVMASPPEEIDADANAVTCAMTKKPISQLTLSNHMQLAAN
uniref:Uncharacterized protein n=1 Tax=Romanomermis culicivorax TaxID=13658 RepID=A0A915IPD7_ROMCU